MTLSPPFLSFAILAVGELSAAYEHGINAAHQPDNRQPILIKPFSHWGSISMPVLVYAILDDYEPAYKQHGKAEC